MQLLICSLIIAPSLQSVVSGRTNDVQLSEWTFDPTLEFPQHIFDHLYINKNVKSKNPT